MSLFWKMRCSLLILAPFGMREDKKTTTPAPLAYWPLPLLITHAVYFSHSSTYSQAASPVKMDRDADLCQLCGLSVTRATLISRISFPSWDIVAVFSRVTLTSESVFSSRQILYFHFISFGPMLGIYPCFAQKEEHFKSLHTCNGNWLIASILTCNRHYVLTINISVFKGQVFLTSSLVFLWRQNTLAFSPSFLVLFVCCSFFLFFCSWYHLVCLCVCVSVLTRPVSVCVCLFICLVSLGQAILAWLPAVLPVILASIDIQTEQLCLFMFFN